MEDGPDTMFCYRCVPPSKAGCPETFKGRLNILGIVHASRIVSYVTPHFGPHTHLAMLINYSLNT